MKNSSIWLILAMLSLLFISCEGNTNRNYSLVNKSTAAVTAKVSTVSDHFVFELIPAQTEMILTLDAVGGTDIAGHPSDYIFKLLIYNQEDTCFKDYKDPDNWHIISEQTKKYPSNWKHIFTFEFDNEDF